MDTGYFKKFASDVTLYKFIKEFEFVVESHSEY